MHLLTQSALLRALGWSLFNSLWQMSLLWAFYHLFLQIFKQLPARARHGLALLLLTAGFCWSVSTFINASYSDGRSFGGRGFFPDTLSRLAIVAGEILPWCSSLYLLILAGLLVRYCGRYIRSRRIVREGLSPLSPELDAFVAAAAGQQGIRVKVNAYLSSLVQVPVTLGFLKPVILLPVAMIAQLTTTQVEAILVHELAHIRRKDYLLNLLISVMELLYFFNPFTRMLIAQLKKEREHCCDDAVLEFRYDPHGYVSALLSLAQQQQQASLALAAVGGGGEQLLLQRARKILQQKRTDDRPGLRPLICFLLTALIPILFLGHARTVHAPRPQPQATIAPAAVRLETIGFVILNAPAAQPQKAEEKTPSPRAHRHPGGHTRLLAKRPSHDPQEALFAESGQSNELFNTADELDNGTPIFTTLTETANRTTAAKRDFSMGKSNVRPAAPTSDPDAEVTENMPFVPQSSFSSQYIDTLPPGEKLALMQELSEEALHLQILRIQQELRQQMQLLRSQEAAVRGARIDEDLQQLLEQQLKVQRQYMLSLKKLQQQLKKNAHRLTIVYI